MSFLPLYTQNYNHNLQFWGVDIQCLQKQLEQGVGKGIKSVIFALAESSNLNPHFPGLK